MIKNYDYEMFVLSSKASSSVKASIYSISIPSGTPCAILVILIFFPSNILEIYLDVVSPSIPGLTAIIISLIFSLSILSNNKFSFISSGLIPSNGEINPSRTWYSPL